MKSLYDSLHVDDISAPAEQHAPDIDVYESLSAKEFCTLVLESVEFRAYIVRGLVCRDLPSAVLCRLIDHGWGKPPERIEHTGPNGQPIETITEVRRVIVRAPLPENDEKKPAPYVTH